MITMIIGENSFEAERAIDDLVSKFDGRIERIDGSYLQLGQLPDILMGASLFSASRLIIVRGLGANKLIWPVFGDWAPRISSDIHLVLVEPKPDKRTTTFKVLKKCATVHEFQSWNERDFLKAEKWVFDEAAKRSIKINKQNIHFLVQWVGVNQWALFHALEKLSLIDKFDDETVKEFIDSNPTDNVFNLIDLATRGDVKAIRQSLYNLRQSQDVYMLLGLLSSQVFQLAVIVNSNSDHDVSRDFAINPYSLSKLKSVAGKLNKSKLSRLINIFADADSDIKSSRVEPWMIVEIALIKTARLFT